MFIELGAKVSTRNKENQSALHLASKYGRYNSCLLMLSLPDSKNLINDKDKDGFTPLHLAAQNGHCKIIKLLMDKGALICRSYHGNTPFHEAAINSHIDAMVLFLHVDFNVINTKNKNEVRPKLFDWFLFQKSFQY